MERSLTYSFTSSFALHFLLLAFYFYWGIVSRPEQLTVIANVSLLEPVKSIPVRRAPAGPRQARRISTWDFLKMAIPAAPRVSQGPELQEPSVTRKLRKSIRIPQKLVERRGTLQTKSGIKMDMKRTQAAKSLAQVADASFKSERISPGQLLDRPIQLEEVGAKRAPALPPGLEWREGDLPARTVTSLKEIKAISSKRVHRPVASAVQMLPSEAAGRKSAGTVARILSKILPSPSPLIEGGGGTGRPRRRLIKTPSLDSIAISKSRTREKALERPSKKKAVEIAGPLSNRKVLQTALPAFPEWLKSKGIMEVSVAIRFVVTSDGRVTEQMRVVRTSGYGALDKLAMEYLREWIFVPLKSTVVQKNQWGVITFRFILER